jgi:FAD/FMN-containing dehydrogenase
MSQKDFEGEIYRKMFKLLDDNYTKIKAAKPHVTKNSTGYNLWDVWDRETGIFDLTKLIVGAQGTLGFVTDIHLRLVPYEPKSGMLVCFMKDTAKLGKIINVVMEHKPSTFESFDDNTLWLSIKFMPFFVKYIGVRGVIKLMLSLIPDALMLLKGIPRLILMIEFTGQTDEEVAEKVSAMYHRLAPYKMAMERDDSVDKEQKFWIMRRQSFNLLRQKVKDKHTAPFIDDLVVPIEYLPRFLPQMRRIIKKYRLLATIAGHMGDGNFHVIPLMKFEDSVERAKLEPAMREVNDLVLKYGGSLSGEHNDGLIRGPWLEKMYGIHITELFRQTKEIFDPSHIFNPHKKANATWDYSMRHLRDHF